MKFFLHCLSHLKLTHMTTFKPSSILFALAALSFHSTSHSAPSSKTLARQDPVQIQQAVQEFVRQQSSTLPGQVTLQVTPPDSRLSLAQCDQPQPFLPQGGRLWGKSAVGVRCTSPANWTIYVQVQIQVLGEYIISSGPISAGQLIKKEHLSIAKGDLCTLPTGIISNIDQAINKASTSPIMAGVPLRLDNLRRPQIIQAGQLVRLNSSGSGFTISTQARAIGGASEGQVIQVRTANGQQISAIAKGAGLVEVTN
jgi:flagellar basal body P-ring formation protein FlgA